MGRRVSRRQLSRTPANFPRMKDRAGGRAIRRQRKLEAQQIRAALAAYNEVAQIISRAFSTALDAVAEIARSAGEAFAGMAEQLRRADSQDAYALAPPVDDGAP